MNWLSIILFIDEVQADSYLPPKKPNGPSFISPVYAHNLDLQDIKRPWKMPDHSAAYLGTAFVTGVCLAFAYQELSRPKHEDNVTEQISTNGLIARAGPPTIVEGIEGCIGNTPLFRIKSLSDETGCEILGKAEVCSLGTSYPNHLEKELTMR